MSRLPPQIKQVVDGQKVTGYSVLPIKHNGVLYTIDSQTRYGESGDILGINWSIEAAGSDGIQLWKTDYFKIDYLQGLETDVQESYPIDFYIKDDQFFIEHEYDQLFQLSLNGVLQPRSREESDDREGIRVTSLLHPEK